MKIKILSRVRRASLAGLGVFALAACSTTASSLSPEVAGSPHGDVDKPRVFTSGAKLYVAGSMKRRIGHALHMAAHVDIQLIDRQGRVIAEKQDDIDAIHPRRDRRHMGRYAYVASFPAALKDQAVTVRVSYHPARHS